MGKLLKISREKRFAYLLNNPEKTEEALLASAARLQKTEHLLKTIANDSFSMEHLPEQTRAMIVSMCGDFGIKVPTKEP